MLNHNGEPVGGNLRRPANAAGFQIHGHLHRRYPHVNAACHAHTVNGKAWSTFGRALEMINQDVAMLYGEAQAVYSEFNGVVFTPEEGERLAKALGPKGKLLILRNHGLLTVGQTVDEAAYLFTLAERSCEIQLKTDAAAASGMPKQLIEDKVARHTFEMTSNPVRYPLLLFWCLWLLTWTLRRDFTASSNHLTILKWRVLEVGFCSDFKLW